MKDELEVTILPDSLIILFVDMIRLEYFLFPNEKTDCCIISIWKFFI